MTRKAKRGRTIAPDTTLEQAPDPAEGFVRPEVIVLSGQAVIPAGNLIAPAPNQFTHQLTRAQPIYFAGAEQGTDPNGELPAATRVVLLVYDGGAHCRVVDGQGLYVEVEYDSLKRL
jgi:hypothetical protein